MALPAGYSSDEDDLDGFGEEDTYDSQPSQNHKSAISPAAEKEIKQNELYLTVINGNITEIQKELQNGFEPNTVLRDNWSLLLLAASVGNPDITKLLIEHGANVNYDRDKFTVLMAACNCPPSCASRANVLNVVQQLLSKDVNVNAVTRKRMTPLMYACSNGNLEVVKLLLPLSNKFATDNQGWNALFWAVNDNRVDIVKLLLEEGFNETQLDVRGNNVLTYAREHNYHKIIECFPSQQDAMEQFYCRDLEDFGSMFEDLQADERPPYFNELYNILCGSKSELMMSHFIDNNINLRSFLCITDEQLQSMGNLLPFQRYKILNSLYRFHKYAYRESSVPRVQNDRFYSNIETAKSIAAAIRQIVCMEASVEYLIINSHMFSDSIDKNLFRNALHNVQEKLRKVKNAAKALHRRARNWDYFNSPADLITKSCRKRKIVPNVVVIGALLLPIIVVACRFLYTAK